MKKSSELMEGVKRLKVDLETKIQPFNSLPAMQQHCKRFHDLMSTRATLDALNTDTTKASTSEKIPHKGIWCPFDNPHKNPFPKYSINGLLADINNNYEEEKSFKSVSNEVVNNCDSTTDNVKCEKVDDEDVVVDVDCEDEKSI